MNHGLLYIAAGGGGDVNCSHLVISSNTPRFHFLLRLVLQDLCLCLPISLQESVEGPLFESFFFFFCKRSLEMALCPSPKKLTDLNRDATTFTHSFNFRFLFTQHNASFLFLTASISTPGRLKGCPWSRLASPSTARRGVLRIKRMWTALPASPLNKLPF